MDGMQYFGRELESLDAERAEERRDLFTALRLTLLSAVVTLAVTGGLCALDYRPLMADGFAVTPLDQPAGD